MGVVALSPVRLQLWIDRQIRIITTLRPAGTHTGFFPGFPPTKDMPDGSHRPRVQAAFIRESQDSILDDRKRDKATHRGGRVPDHEGPLAQPHQGIHRPSTPDHIHPLGTASRSELGADPGARQEVGQLVEQSEDGGRKDNQRE